MSTRNEHTLAPIFSNARSGEAQRRYDEGYDRIFRKQPSVVAEPGADHAVEHEPVVSEDDDTPTTA